MKPKKISHCRKCGKQIADTFTFCPNCGAKQTVQAGGKVVTLRMEHDFHRRLRQYSIDVDRSMQEVCLNAIATQIGYGD